MDAGFYATRLARTTAPCYRDECCQNRVIQDRLFFLLSKTIPSKIGNTDTHYRHRPLCRRLTDDAEGQLGTNHNGHIQYQTDTDQHNLVWSNTYTTAGIGTNPPRLSLPTAIVGHKRASNVNRMQPACGPASQHTLQDKTSAGIHSLPNR